MASVLSFANQKGGVGKSTLCIQYGFYLALKKKKKILVIDMDAQGNTSSRLAGDDPFTGTKTSELFQHELPTLNIMRCSSGIDLIHTPKNDPELYEIEAMPIEDVFLPAKHLESIINQYDEVIIDCPPSLGRKLVAALVMSTHVVCPVKLSGFAVDGIEGLLSTINAIQGNANPTLKVLGIIINDMDNSASHQKALETLEEAIPDEVFKNKLKHRPPLDSATTDGIPIWEVRHGRVAAGEVKLVMDEIIDRMRSR